MELSLCRTDASKLGVPEIMALYQVKEGQFALIKSELLKKLEMQQLITRSTHLAITHLNPYIFLMMKTFEYIIYNTIK